MPNKMRMWCHSPLASTESISPLVSDEGIAGMAREDSGHLFLMFGSSLSGKILTSENLIYLYLHFLVICKSLIVSYLRVLCNIFL